MIPSTTNRLLIAEDWTKIYQSFKNADFKSYDFETLRRTMFAYLREKYPEDFNDYIDSSEYVALIDVIAFLGQNLSFRIDLNARENFLETAERRESILKLARLINYNANRNVPASGFLKITNITTTDSIIDANGINLANTPITWNDPTNSNWYAQFITIMNSAMPAISTFGKPYDRATIDGILTEQYNINSISNDVPVYTFNKSINGTSMPFEIVPASFSGSASIYEVPPKPGNQLSLIYKNDIKGAGSSNTGFFAHFKQGSLSLANFSIDSAVPNDIIGVNASNINNTDVWLWQLSASGSYNELWTKVESLVGNNVIYNSIDKSIRSIYSVLTREQDQIDLNFADGSFGDLPKGQFRLFYRQSNGLKYVIQPNQIRNINIEIPYENKSGKVHKLTLTLSLQYSVVNAAGAETNADIKLKAPQSYYVQNRMITAEDYNIAPLSVSSDILKLKSINRISSGISKYYELSDISGKYSKTNIFATDGILYQDEALRHFEFYSENKVESIAIVKSEVEPILTSPSLNNFYLQNFDRADISTLAITWKTVNKTTNQTRGYFYNAITPITIGSVTSGLRKFFVPDALVKFVPPTGKYFLPTGKLTSIADATTTSYLWSTIIQVTGDGANGGLGALSDGTGPVLMSGVIPDGAIPVELIPKFVTTLSLGFEVEISNMVAVQTNFGLSYDQTKMSWYVISAANLDLSGKFSLTNQRDVSNTSKDASWLLLFSWDGKKYTVQYHYTDYIFESNKETAFFVDKTSVNYDFTSASVIKDQISVLSINTAPATTSTQALGADYLWQIDTAIVEPDGYIEPKRVVVSFYDAKNDGQIDDPDAFNNIVMPLSTSTQTGFRDKFVYFKTTGTTRILVDSSAIIAYDVETDILSPEDKQLYYFYNSELDVVKSYDANNVSFTLEPDYLAVSGRSNLKFHYTHNSGENRRLDPSKTNLIDIYVLSSAYDTEYRNWLISPTDIVPLPPTSNSLTDIYSTSLNSIKAISDELIFHPASYKLLFGPSAPTNLQAVFKAVRNTQIYNSDNDLKSRILTAITDFFSIENWDFGDSFYFSELSTYVMNIMTPDISNFVIVPRADANFGSLYEITCENNEIFINGATINDIAIISALSQSELKMTSVITAGS